MASLQLDPKSGRYRIRFYYGGQEYKRSIKTKSEEVARGILGRVEETVRLLEQGRIEMPADVDPGRFILSDGKRTSKPVVQKLLTLDALVTLSARSWSQYWSMFQSPLDRGTSSDSPTKWPWWPPQSFNPLLIGAHPQTTTLNRAAFVAAAEVSIPS